MSIAAERAAVARLRDPATIRTRCRAILALAEAGALEHFRLRPERLDTVAERVEGVTRAAYPELRVPVHGRWRHLDVGGRGRVAELQAQLAEETPREQARAQLELVITSVLLDAGAGPRWRYREAVGGATYTRSEGLAVASYEAFCGGLFAADRARPRADAAGLQALTAESLGEAFAVAPDNPLVGLEGRAELMRRLGNTVAAAPEWFGPESPRLGGLLDALVARAPTGELPAAELLQALLVALAPIWPGRVSLAGENLGDVWPHPALSGPEPGDGLIPFHKLSQWLAYSLIEPLALADIRVVELGALTGLPEYRNGGLLLDLGALELVDPGARARAHAPGDPLIVEWRALTVVLLDQVAERVRARLGLDAEAFPLAKVLEGGTWSAGRQVARELREDGAPPLRLVSDGTVF